MPTDASFRFSTYLSLALACAALGYSESELLPEVIGFALLAIISLGVLYFLESRVTFLSIPAANRLGMAIGLIYMMWAAWRVKREIDTHEFINMGWAMLIVALCGPLVMVALVAKVARSDKHAGDYWTLHGVALVGVGLSAALAEEVVCFILVGVYLVAAVWSLTLLHFGRASGAVPPIPGGPPPATKTIAVSADPTGHRTDFYPAIRWALIALSIAVPLYLLTPRSNAVKADFGKPRIEIGYAADQMVDLNRTGPLKTNTEVAFEFTAYYPDGKPKTNCNPEQRWRGKVMRHYSSGEWKTAEDTPLPHITYASSRWRVGDDPLLAHRMETWSPPNLGAGQYTLSFDVPGRLHPPPLADPLLWVPNESPPVAVLTRQGEYGWLPVPDGTFYWEPASRSTILRYLQVYRPKDDPDVGPPFHFINSDFEDNLTTVRHNPVPRVKEYADHVLNDLVAAGELPKDFRSELTLEPKPQYQDLIARKFTQHLATTPTLTYSTDLRRENKSVDPIEDFLFYSKAGHCERFATALVLMLRSQGIPAVFVLGFKGCEHLADGRYIVRQEHAHAWVSALVAKPDQPEVVGDPRYQIYYWRSLDPTPDIEHMATPNLPWWRRANEWMETRFETYVTNYNSQERRKALRSLVTRLTHTGTLASIGGAILLLSVGYFAFRRYTRYVNKPSPDTESMRWFNQLVSLLGAHGISPTPNDTPREFATQATIVLRERGLAEVADVPLFWADVYYQDRFGGIPPTDARLAELGAALEKLRQTLEK